MKAETHEAIQLSVCPHVSCEGIGEGILLEDEDNSKEICHYFLGSKGNIPAYHLSPLNLHW